MKIIIESKKHKLKKIIGKVILITGISTSAFGGSLTIVPTCIHSTGIKCTDAGSNLKTVTQNPIPLDSEYGFRSPFCGTQKGKFKLDITLSADTDQPKYLIVRYHPDPGNSGNLTPPRDFTLAGSYANILVQGKTYTLTFDDKYNFCGSVQLLFRNADMVPKDG
ncbi:MAG: hypothetical protein K0R14_799 [Burkholderiales bacterium]|jgi:hypothetical protein|nr:hypothetical protein [Burkholderiales bacterium]